MPGTHRHFCPAAPGCQRHSPRPFLRPSAWPLGWPVGSTAEVRRGRFASPSAVPFQVPCYTVRRRHRSRRRSERERCLSLSSTQDLDRKSTRLNSSHGYISYAVFCLKKKKKHDAIQDQSVSTESTH